MMMEGTLRNAARTRVLLAEDNMFEARMVLGVLRNMGLADVTHMRDGASAADLIRPEMPPFDLIISDWTMPEMSGLELLRHVRGVWRHTPFLMVTGHATVDFVIQAKANAVDAYIVKPFSPRDLAAKIAQLLGSR